jgi:aconitate hydratase
VLSGNRNFEARIHPNLKANFLASPPLVVAYAIAGTVLRDLMSEPVGQGTGGRDVYLGDIWPHSDEIDALMRYAMNAKAYRANYAKLKSEPGALWDAIQGGTKGNGKAGAKAGTPTAALSGKGSSQVYSWPKSTYIAEPPFFQDFTMEPKALVAGVQGARIMGLFGDSITTDHISPAGSFAAGTPAGQYLLSHGVLKPDFNSYGARRGNHEVMMRGTFANVRIKNLMIPPQADGSRVEGGFTLFQLPIGAAAARAAPEQLPIFEAAMRYMAAGTPTVVLAGEEYGTGSSRDWAAKGTALLGIKAVVARSFERIHRSNLIGMGVLPLQFMPGTSWQTLGLVGSEVIDVELAPDVKPLSQATLVITRADGNVHREPVVLRIDTPIEVDYYKHGGILPFVLRQLLAA